MANDETKGTYYVPDPGSTLAEFTEKERYDFLKQYVDNVKFVPKPAAVASFMEIGYVIRRLLNHGLIDSDSEFGVFVQALFDDIQRIQRVFIFADVFGMAKTMGVQMPDFDTFYELANKSRGAEEFSLRVFAMLNDAAKESATSGQAASRPYNIQQLSGPIGEA